MIVQESVSVYDKRQVSITVSGVEPVPASYLVSMFQPTTLVLRYKRYDSEAWGFYMVAVFGPKIKKDGNRSQMNGRRSWLSREDSPEWLQELIDQYMPTN